MEAAKRAKGRLHTRVFLLSIALLSSPGVMLFYGDWDHSPEAHSFASLSVIFANCGLLGLIASIFLRERYRAVVSEEERPTRALASWFAVAFGLICNGMVAWSSLPFVTVPQGEWIRPMGWAGGVALLALACGILGGLFTVIGLVIDREDRLGILGGVLAISPLPLSFILTWLLAAICGFHFNS